MGRCHYRAHPLASCLGVTYMCFRDSIKRRLKDLASSFARRNAQPRVAGRERRAAGPLATPLPGTRPIRRIGPACGRLRRPLGLRRPTSPRVPRRGTRSRRSLGRSQNSHRCCEPLSTRRRAGGSRTIGRGAGRRVARRRVGRCDGRRGGGAGFGGYLAAPSVGRARTQAEAVAPARLRSPAQTADSTRTGLLPAASRRSHGGCNAGREGARAGASSSEHFGKEVSVRRAGSSAALPGTLRSDRSLSATASRPLRPDRALSATASGVGSTAHGVGGAAHVVGRAARGVGAATHGIGAAAHHGVGAAAPAMRPQCAQKARLRPSGRSQSPSPGREPPASGRRPAHRHLSPMPLDHPP